MEVGGLLASFLFPNPMSVHPLTVAGFAAFLKHFKSLFHWEKDPGKIIFPPAAAATPGNYAQRDAFSDLSSSQSLSRANSEAHGQEAAKCL